ncbi:MAG TPA: SRPBCC family protein [Acidimicrobiales bacterium]|nr:SRPBCC family protein [Acidimicrobiales bacterium]
MTDLVREIMIDATPETIWPFLTQPSEIVRWHGTVAELDPRPGGVYRVLVAGQFQSAGQYIEVVSHQKVVFTFGWDHEGHPIPAGSTTVEISLHPEGDKTRVRLVHHGLPEDAMTDHDRGWEHYLGRLAIAVGGGDPGPDTQTSDPDTTA